MIAGVRRDFGNDVIVELATLIVFKNVFGKFSRALSIPLRGFANWRAFQTIPRSSSSREVAVQWSIRQQTWTE